MRLDIVNSLTFQTKFVAFPQYIPFLLYNFEGGFCYPMQ
jgi:hypothetical protein